MSHWTPSSVRACGDKSQMLALLKKMNEAGNHHEANGHYDDLVRSLGYTPQAEEAVTGVWSKLQLLPDGTLEWEDLCRYIPALDAYKCIERAFPGIKVYFFNEDIERGEWVTNDAEHQFFPERFILHQMLEKTNHDIEHWNYQIFNSLDELAAHLANLAAQPLTTLADVKAFVDARNDLLLDEVIIVE